MDELKQQEELKRDRHLDPRARWKLIQDMITWGESQPVTGPFGPRISNLWLPQSDPCGGPNLCPGRVALRGSAVASPPHSHAGTHKPMFIQHSSCLLEARQSEIALGVTQPIVRRTWLGRVMPHIFPAPL